MKQYKAIPGPKNVGVTKGNLQSAFNLFAELMNAESKNGWSYHSMETITVTEKPGCLSSPTSTVCYMLIFEREI